MSLHYEMYPLGPWTDPVTKPRQSCSAFRATWSATIDLLEREASMLSTRLIRIDIDVREGDIRLDGLLRADAKVTFPGVRVHLIGTKFGDLQYATDRYESRYSGDRLKSWQANIRAIALALEALRAVDRYGVSTRGEQYTGWKALPAGSGVAATSKRDAAEFLERLVVGDEGAGRERTVQQILDGGLPDAARLIREARAATHPDRNGGDRAAWDRVEEAAKVLGLMS